MLEDKYYSTRMVWRRATPQMMEPEEEDEQDLETDRKEWKTNDKEVGDIELEEYLEKVVEELKAMSIGGDGRRKRPRKESCRYRGINNVGGFTKKVGASYQENGRGTMVVDGVRAKIRGKRRMQNNGKGKDGGGSQMRRKHKR